MRLFHRRSNLIGDNEAREKIEPISNELDDSKKLVDQLVSQSDARVSRRDYTQAILDSLLLLHPEIKDQAPMIEFVSRIKRYLEEHPGEEP